MTVEKVLAEANLSEDQIKQIAGIVDAARLDERAKLEETHSEELEALTESKDESIRALMEEAVESKKSLNAILAEKVIEKPRRISVMVTPDIAVGIDIDQGGTLAFTVTDKNGSAVAEINKPDSVAVKAWFASLQEGCKKTLREGGYIDKDDVGEDDKVKMEARLSKKIYAEVDKTLTEVLAPLRGKIKQANAYATLSEKFKLIAESVAPHLSSESILDESKSSSELLAVTQERDALLAERVAREKKEVFAELTEGLAETTIEKVAALVESANPNSVKEYRAFLEVSVKAIKPATKSLEEKVELPAPTKINSYMSKL